MQQQEQIKNEINSSDSSNFKTLHNFKIKYTPTQINKKNKFKSQQKKYQSYDHQKIHQQLKNQNQKIINEVLINYQSINTNKYIQNPQRIQSGFNLGYQKNIIQNYNKIRQSNLLENSHKNKISSIIIDKIQQMKNKEQKFLTKSLTNPNQRPINFHQFQLNTHQKQKYLADKSNKLIQKQNQKCNNLSKGKKSQVINYNHYQNNEQTKTLLQPFVNKKIIHSFDQQQSISSSDSKIISNQNKKNNGSLNKQLNSLQINFLKEKNKNNVNQQAIQQMIEQMTKINMNYMNQMNNFNAYNYSLMQTPIIKKNRYKKKKLEPLKVTGTREKMSNNIKDYLSVQRIQIKQMEDQLLSQTTHSIQSKYSQRQTQMDKNDRNSKTQIKYKSKLNQAQTLPNNFQYIKKKVKFVPPFNTYYYRDFIWKVAYSNQLLVESPPDYQNKIKVYLGKGNNSNLIKGLIRRRPWYQITQKYQQAHFVWTQIKIQSYFTLQKTRSKIIRPQSSLDSPLDQKRKQSFHPILNEEENIKFSFYWNKNIQKQMKFKQNMKNRSKLLNLKQKPISQIILNTKIHNHFRNNYIIGNKKALFSLMNKYYSDLNQQVFDFLPLSFHIKNGLQDQQYLKFLNNFYSISKQIKKLQQKELNQYIYKHNAWIVKPGQNTNRGNGIIVCLTLNQIKSILKKKQKHNDGTYKTYILQKYIEKPLLYKKRKFDLRHYILMTCTNGIIKGYWYKQGYVRTTSTEYTLKFSSGSVHLTNDAVQKQLPDYGKYQKGNKISYEELNQFIKKNDKKFDFFTVVYPKMKKIATDLMKASAKLMDPQKKQNNFQIFGLDFMIDQAYNVWLIQCNSNPCLQLSCPLLGKIIPKMVENTFRICLDPIFVPPTNFVPKCQEYYQNINQQNNFQLVYDQRKDFNINQKGGNSEFLDNKQFQDDDDTFDDDGQDWDN